MLANKIYNESNLETMAQMPDEFIDCVVTSPPYFGLRDYGVDGQLGLEATPQEYVAKMVEVFEEVRRVLKKDGTLWLNLGDSYAGSGKGRPSDSLTPSCEQLGVTSAKSPPGLKPKDLIGIPWRVAFALQEAGWWLRQDIIWSKPNPMPESVTDRCTKSHEYMFLLTKSANYYYDNEAIKEPLKDGSIARLLTSRADGKVAISALSNADKSPYSKQHANRDRSLPRNRNGITGTLDHKNVKAKGQQPHSMHLSRLTGASDAEYFAESTKKQFDISQAGGGSGVSGHSGYFKEDGSPLCGVMANKKSVWTVTTRPFKDAHFATFPEQLIVPCILAGSRAGGIVYDPFGGAGTTALVSHKLGRQWILSELNPDYVEIANKRLEPHLAQGGLFA